MRLPAATIALSLSLALHAAGLWLASRAPRATGVPAPGRGQPVEVGVVYGAGGPRGGASGDAPVAMPGSPAPPARPGEGGRPPRRRPPPQLRAAAPPAPIAQPPAEGSENALGRGPSAASEAAEGGAGGDEPGSGPGSGPGAGAGSGSGSGWGSGSGARWGVAGNALDLAADEDFALAQVARRLAIAAEGCYPRAALRMRASGTVRIEFRIDDQGRATDSSVVESSGLSLFDAAALGCVLERAAPLPPVRERIRVPVQFRFRSARP